MHGTREDLYERDFYAWTRREAGALRRLAAARPSLDLDLAHIAEEIAGLGKEQLNALRSWTVRILEHLLLLEHSPATEPRRHWTREVINFRAEIAARLTRTLRADLARRLPPSTIRRAGSSSPSWSGSAKARQRRGCRRRAPIRGNKLLETAGQMNIKLLEDLPSVIGLLIR